MRDDIKDVKDLPLDAGPRRAHPGGVPRGRLPVPDDAAYKVDFENFYRKSPIKF